MELLEKILKWIVTWTAILFVPIFALSVLATVIVATRIGSNSVRENNDADGSDFFLFTSVLAIWTIGISTICG